MFFIHGHTQRESFTLSLTHYEPCDISVSVLCHPTTSKHLESVIIWTEIKGHALLASNEGRENEECKIQTQRQAETKRQQKIRNSGPLFRFHV